MGYLVEEGDWCPETSILAQGLEEALRQIESSPPPPVEEWAEELKGEIREFENTMNGSYANLYFSDKTTPLGAVCWSFWERRHAAYQIFWWQFYAEGTIGTFPEISVEVRELEDDELADRSLQSITENIIRQTIPEIERTLNNVGIGNTDIEWRGDKPIGEFAEIFLERLTIIRKFGTSRLKNQSDFTSEDISQIFSRLRVSAYRDILTDEVDEIITSPEPEGCNFNAKTFNKYEVIEEDPPPDIN